MTPLNATNEAPRVDTSGIFEYGGSGIPPEQKHLPRRQAGSSMASQPWSSAKGDNYHKESILMLICQFSYAGIALSVSDILELITEPCTSDCVISCISELTADVKIVKIYDEYYYSKEAETGFLLRDLVRSSEKLKKTERILKILSALPTVKYVGISGSNTFDLVQANDDVDIFMIVKKDTLFITRLITFLITAIFGSVRTKVTKQAKDRICTNVILEEDSLDVPYPKQNLFSARELIRVRFYAGDRGLWARLESQNIPWVGQRLPNYNVSHVEGARDIGKVSRANKIFELTNSFLGFLQLWYMKAYVTNELLAFGQLWLHPNTRDNTSSNLI